MDERQCHFRHNQQCEHPVEHIWIDQLCRLRHGHERYQRQENDGGGGCNGVGMHDNVSNITIEYNIFHWLEEPIKTYESPSSGVVQ